MQQRQLIKSRNKGRVESLWVRRKSFPVTIMGSNGTYDLVFNYSYPYHHSYTSLPPFGLLVALVPLPPIRRRRQVAFGFCLVTEDYSQANSTSKSLGQFVKDVISQHLCSQPWKLVVGFESYKIFRELSFIKNIFWFMPWLSCRLPLDFTLIKLCYSLENTETRAGFPCCITFQNLLTVP